MLSTATWALNALPSWNTTSSRTVKRHTVGAGWVHEVASEGDNDRSAF